VDANYELDNRERSGSEAI